MAQKKNNWAKEAKNGLLMGFVLCAAVFMLLFLSFFDLYALSHLRLNAAKMYADTIYRQGDLRAEALFDQGEIGARKAFLNACQTAVVDFDRSCAGGVTAYWSAFGRYWNRYFTAHKVYSRQVADLKKARDTMCANAHKEGENIIRQAWAEIDPLFLVFKGKESGEIRGYFYDPANGKLAPQIGVVNKGKISHEKK